MRGASIGALLDLCYTRRNCLSICCWARLRMIPIRGQPRPAEAAPTVARCGNPNVSDTPAANGTFLSLGTALEARISTPLGKVRLTGTLVQLWARPLTSPAADVSN